MACLEVLHEVAGLDRGGLGDGAREEVDGDGVGVAGGRDEGGEDELRQFADAGDGVEVGFAESADAEEGEQEGEDEGEGRVGDGEEVGEGEVDGDVVEGC